MAKKLTDQQIRDVAAANNIRYSALKAVQTVEAKGDGFLATGEPLILFERHIFYRKLRELGYLSLTNQFVRLRPDLCSRFGSGPGGYGKTNQQHARLQQAQNLVFQALPNLNKTKPDDQKIINDVRDCALMACSWGIGQVMGMNWQELGYPSLQQFINDMYDSEAKQLEAMVRFIKSHGLVDEMQRGDWSAFARIYNGPDYRTNQYDSKLAKANQMFA